jgi:[CysO sulfur-carrier protein]-S-L-cysteine hydrolase
VASPKISRSNMDLIVAQAEREFPYECCGFIIGSSSGDDSIEDVRPIVNIQNAQHAKDPSGFPRDARTAFLMDPKEHLAVMREIDDRKLALKIVYHSHPDHEAYFSPTDRRQACSFDPDYPDYPETAYVVLSIMAGKFHRAAAFVWDSGKKEFVEGTMTIS